MFDKLNFVNANMLNKEGIWLLIDQMMLYSQHLKEMDQDPTMFIEAKYFSWIFYSSRPGESASIIIVLLFSLFGKFSFSLQHYPVPVKNKVSHLSFV